MYIVSSIMMMCIVISCLYIFSNNVAQCMLALFSYCVLLEPCCLISINLLQESGVECEMKHCLLCRYNYYVMSMN